MKDERLYSLIMDYLDGNLQDKQKSELQQLLEDESMTIDDILELKIIASRMKKLDIPEPTKRMDTKFYAMLEAEKRISIADTLKQGFAEWLEEFSFSRFASRISYAAVILILGGIIGYWFAPDRSENQLHQMSVEIQNLKQVMMIAMLDEPFATDRLKAVNLAYELDAPGQQIIDVLIHTLNNDPNDNVRIAAVEALIPFLDNPDVKNGMIESIPFQSSPLVQLALVNRMGSMNMKDSLPYLKELLHRDDLHETIRGRVVETIEVLT